MKRIEMIGQVFEMLTVMEYAGSKKTSTYYLCQCSCGNKITTTRRWLINGRAKSCGCSKNNFISRSNTRHGESQPGKKTVEYMTWNGIKNRCYNEKDHNYDKYGGRGISVCSRWIESYDNFLSDMGRRPPGKYSLDRIDNNKGYSPDNCRWATNKEQSRNTRTNRIIEFKGQEMTLTEWSETLGLKVFTLAMKLKSKTIPEIIKIQSLCRAV
jgi:hypothetical protein